MLGENPAPTGLVAWVAFEMFGVAPFNMDVISDKGFYRGLGGVQRDGWSVAGAHQNRWMKPR